MKFRDSASYGKRQEYIAVSELLKRDFDVYMTLVDDQGIDCIIRINENRYLDIQIKARSKNASGKDRAYFPRLKVPEGRDNLFYIFYSEGVNAYWVIPSQDIISLAKQKGTNVSQNLTGNSAGRYALRLAGYSSVSGTITTFDRFEMYKGENGFELLK
ncbi:hypothetical protein [Alkalihalophilus marmarensis]|uniref:hypothetical protein n=1 Tax=Alkalihalophilus marmarensis TaxID=521377 RepID=UPI002DBDEC1D|nr:hypothetical protein [Alkalihalophilus marmarensis]MEC2073750.1 hypothetical protein [Alkalihalophilus marmarensis]